MKLHSYRNISFYLSNTTLYCIFTTLNAEIRIIIYMQKKQLILLTQSNK